MTQEVELFMNAGQQLANHSGLPAQTPQLNRQYSRISSDEDSLTKIILGNMLAQVAVVPQDDLDRVHVLGYGDQEILETVRGNIHGSTLTIEADLPYKPSSRHQPGGSPFGGGIHIGGGNVFIGSGASFVNINLGGTGATIINGVIFIDGQELDLNRKIMLILIVPRQINISVRKVIGVVGVAGFLDGELAVKSGGVTNVFAYDVGSFKCNLSGHIEAHLENVRGNFNADMSGSGVVTVGAVGGRFKTDISGSAQVTVKGGTSTSASIDISGSGRVTHKGLVTGDADVDISGSAQAKISRVDGEVDCDISGSGSAVVNGHTYRMRRHW